MAASLSVRPARPVDVALLQGLIPLPAGSSVLGVVVRDDGASGLLVRTAAGLLAQVNAGVMRTLDQQAAEAALLGIGA